MMYPLKEFKDVEKIKKYVDKKGNIYSDDIYTFDIETTSMFLINGKYQAFDKSITDYSGIEKKGCCYHCQFSVNDKVYYFREIAEFENVLKAISNKFVEKIIYIHNLAFETEWLLPILKKYTIIDMIARESRKPISYHIKELNITFRCSFMLTNLSLEKSAEKYTNVKKAKGDLDYSIIRSPLTKLTEVEKYYCEMDCICVYEIIKYFRKEYGHIKLIPYTQTGEMRRAYKKVVPKYHYNYVRQLVPDLDEYNMLVKAFAGGITHGNILYIKEFINEKMVSFDICSSYIASMLTEKYPVEKLRKIETNMNKYYSSNEYAKLYDLTLKGIKAKMYNHYISFSKCEEYKNIVLDNGRVVKADYIRTTITDVDFEMIKKSYKIEEIIYNEIRVAEKDYLPKYFIEFLLKLYADKTTLKNVDGKEDLYMKGKQFLNSTFGACVMNAVQSSVVLDKGVWKCSVDSDEFKKSKLDEQKSEDSYTLFVYSTGVWITAYSRRNLFERLIDNNYELDSDVVYYDTDSLKILNGDKHIHIFEEYNKSISRKLLEMCVHYNIPFSKCKPKDIKGIEHLIGVYEIDGEYSEFCTLGAKRYCYRSLEDNEIHITVSGVNKKAVSALKNDIHNFNTELFFDYDTAMKNISCYNDNQEPFEFIDCFGNKYYNDWNSAIVLYPTTYEMSINPDFEDFINYINGIKGVEEQNDFNVLYKKLNRKRC